MNGQIAYPDEPFVITNRGIINQPANLSHTNFLTRGFEELEITTLNSYFVKQKKIPAIAVIDSGVKSDHQDFANDQFVQQYNTIDDNNDITDESGHGTMICGTIAANTTSTTYTNGIVPEAKIIVFKSISKSNSNISNVTKALKKVIEINNDISSNYEIITVCLALSFDDHYWSHKIAVADPDKRDIANEIDKLYTKNIPVITAGGNYFFKYGCQIGLTFPAIHPNCIVAGSVLGHKRLNNTSIIIHKSTGAVNYKLHENYLGAFTQRFPGVHFTLAGGNSIRPLLVEDEEHHFFLTPHGHHISTNFKNNGTDLLFVGSSASTAFLAGFVHKYQLSYIASKQTIPAIDDIIEYLTSNSEVIQDCDFGQDNVTHPYLNSYYLINKY